jgi:type IV pilus assembly protein PilB
MINMILQQAIKMGASDIHMEPFEKTARIRYRIDGVLQVQKSPPKSVYPALVSRIKVMANLDIAEKRLPQDGRVKMRLSKKKVVDLRISILPTNFGEKVVIRILDSSALCLDLSLLGFESRDMSKYKKAIHSPNGIILITGPTGSGKTTTLYSTLTTLNHPDVNISTIEDPVEYVLNGIIQIQARADIGLTFAAGLRTLLRQDPDVIMVGEIRDKETAEIAINAALTGHLVLATLHTNDAPTVVTRLDNMGIEPFHISGTIRICVAQRLIRKICEDCRESYTVEAETMYSYGLKPSDIEDAEELTLYKGSGCSTCSNTGYKGRIGIYEIMEMTNDLKNAINRKAPTTELKKISMRKGMKTLRQAAVKKVLDGVTTIDEMLRVTGRSTG